jgi:hypothetical protein
MSEFFRTQMGRRFFESTMPALVEGIAKATEAMSRLATALEKSNDAADARPALLNPCDECQKAEAIVSLPWDRTRKVCADCWYELSDGAPIADTDRIKKGED